AGADVDAAYEAAQQKMDLDQPINSRFVIRLGSEFHNCWDDCAANATEMMNAITAMAAAVPLTQVDSDLVTSKAMKLTEGIISSSGGRFETNLIALYAFKTGSGPTAFDTSGVEPAMDLTLSGAHDWVGGWGIQFTGGKAQASTTSSAKLFNQLVATSEYSIEAWVAPANVSQDGPARIISYSGSSTTRNFMLGQTLYNYDTFNRSDLSNAAGEPQLSTDDNAEVLQASLQHVVLTYDPTNGRRLYVNGQFTGDIDTVSGGLLDNWDDKFAFVLGSEVDGNNAWAGTIRMLAIHSRVLTEAQIQQNFDVGVGEKYYVLFNVSDHIGITDAYVVFEVSQFDSYSYLFNQPFFVVLDPQATPDNIRMQGLRIGLNGREITVSQGFANLDVTITQAAYSVDGQQQLSAQGTIIPLEKGPALDEFFLTFEILGSATNVYVETSPSSPLPPPDLPRGPAVGIRDFAEVNATMSSMTGIPVSDAGVMATYDRVKQAMPVNSGLGGFISSQQMGVTQLAIEYCSTLVDDPSLRTDYWPIFDWSAPLASAFDDRAAVIDPLLDNMVGSGLNTQPLRVTLTDEVNTLIDRLRACGVNCESDRVQRIMKGTCAAVMGSAVMMVQ
ncbi:MAG: LamG domain-containing protein, partial [Proteobacteria bacterium]|nr:LamG domain-containing protein [Pseudomonadota bacterium]